MCVFACVRACDNHIISLFAAARVIAKHLKASDEFTFPPTDVSQVKSLLILLIPVTTEFVITLLSLSKEDPLPPIVFILTLPQTTATKDMQKVFYSSSIISKLPGCTWVSSAGYWSFLTPCFKLWSCMFYRGCDDPYSWSSSLSLGSCGSPQSSVHADTVNFYNRLSSP